MVAPVPGRDANLGFVLQAQLRTSSQGAGVLHGEKIERERAERIERRRRHWLPADLMAAILANVVLR